MNKIDNNFELLINRKQGQLFDVKDGELVSLSWFQRIRYAVQNSYRQAVQARLKPLVSSLAGRITDETQVQSLKRLPLSIFDRTALSQSFLKSMTPKLTEEQKTDNPEMNLMIRRIELAFRLGIRPQGTDEGTSGSYFLKDIRGKKLGIFKPADEEVLATHTPKLSSKIKKIFYKIFPSPTSTKCMEGAGYKAEEASSRISEYLGLYTVPLTRITRLSHPDFYYLPAVRDKGTLPLKEGSLQTFVQNSETAEVALGISDLSRYASRFYQWLLSSPERKGKLYERICDEEFQRFAIIDFLVGNLDRHLANWMLPKDSTAETTEISAIDNGYAMPHKHPEKKRTNQYLWRILPHAQVNFGADAREIAADLNEQQIIDILMNTDKNPNKQCLINEGQRDCLRDRIRILKHFVASGKTPFELAQVKRQTAVAKVLEDLADSAAYAVPAGALAAPVHKKKYSRACLRLALR